MSLLLFLLVLTPLALSSVKGQEPPRQNCDGKNSYGSLCCQGEEYSYPGYINQHFVESCNVEPKTDNLTFQDSVWLAYDCHVRAWLNGTQLTKQAFISWISQLPQPRQNKLWNFLSTDDKISTETAEDETTKIHKIKSYFFEYLESVLKICSSGLSDDGAGDWVEKMIWEKLTNSLENCSSGALPRFLYYGLVGSYERFKNCKTEFYNFLGESTYDQFDAYVILFCDSASANFSMSELENEDLDFQTTLNYYFPKFWSKSVKERARENILDKLISGLGFIATNVEDTISNLWVRIDERLASLQSDNATLDTNVIQPLRNLHFSAFVSTLLWSEKNQMCSPSS